MESEGFKVIHNVPATAEANAQMNFFRGKIAAFEDLLGLAEELENWRSNPTKHDAH